MEVLYLKMEFKNVKNKIKINLSQLVPQTLNSLLCLSQISTTQMIEIKKMNYTFPL